MRTYTVGATSLLTNRLSNEFRLNYSSNDATTNDAIDAFGGNTPVSLAKLVGFRDNTAASFAYFPNNFAIIFQDPNYGPQRQWNFLDTLSVALGSHQLKFGADYRRLAPIGALSSPGVSYNYLDEPSIESPNSAFVNLDHAFAYFCFHS